MTVFALIAILGVMITLPGFSQTTEPDPEIQKAKEETVAVYDLGRFFGYVATMEEENSKLLLSPNQVKIFYDIMAEIEGSERIEPDWALESLEYLELDVLTPDQLIAVDQLAIAREATRETGTGQGSGGTGSGPIVTYIAGGAFNPIVDESKSIGEGFYTLYRSLANRTGK